MALEQFFRIFWARKWLALATFLLIVGTAVAGSMLWPKKYSASAQVMLNMKGMDAVSGMPSAASATGGFMATELDVIRSNRVALRVVDELKFAASPLMQRDHAKSGTAAPLRALTTLTMCSTARARSSSGRGAAPAPASTSVDGRSTGPSSPAAGSRKVS